MLKSTSTAAIPKKGREVSKPKIAIIGAGIAGLYCGRRLDMEGQHDFLIAEASSHIGGRIWTTRILNDGYAEDGDTLEGSAETGFTVEKDDKAKPVEFCAEFGPMRIELELQRYLDCVLLDLDLKKDIEQFPPYKSPTSRHDPKYELKGEESEQETPLDLLMLGIVRVFGKIRVEPNTTCDAKDLDVKLTALITKLGRAAATRQAAWKSILLHWAETLDEPDYQSLRQYGVFEDGSPEGTSLWNIGFWNLLSEVLSHHAVSKLRDLGTFYHLIPENPNAVEWLIFWLRGFRTSNQLVGIKGGMQRIPEELKKAIDKKQENRIHKNLRLVELAFADDGKRAKLVFHKTKDGVDIEGESETWLAEHVILALPRGPLQELAQRNAERLYKQLHRDLDSVFGFPLVKVFLGVKERWWNENIIMANRYATLIPTRELHYWPSAKSRRGLVMVYTDRPASTFWSNYIMHNSGSEPLPSGIQTIPELGDYKGNPRLIRKMLQYLEDYGVRRRPDDVEFYGIRDWGREPYLGAAHSWYAERESWKFLKRFSAFGIGNYDCDHHTPKEQERILHICGEAYSDYQAFIEGALRSSEHILHMINPVVFPETPTPWLCDDGKCVHKNKPRLPQRFEALLELEKKAPEAKRGPAAS